ncbi:Integrase catalytic core protein [Phytophthora palmivora]|uniref:Integrase catalytic core protein n=1 Tax=Phytophthora palmivora TaxID=4796 RepID=A0A2P4XSE3_9STRA|nr:Integrase catalytic core protein [Phytophthora palmivora]
MKYYLVQSQQELVCKYGAAHVMLIYQRPNTNQKLSERAIECKLLGLSDSYEGYRLSDIKENRYLIARDVKFGTTYTEGLISRSFPSGEINVNNENITEICDLGKRDREIDVSETKKRPRVVNEHENSVGSTETVGDVGQRVFVPPIPRSCRTRRPNSRLRDYVVSMNAVTISTKVIPIPTSIKEARKGPHAQQWENALQIEYQALVANNTWDIVTLPKGCKILGYHWVFDVKYNPDGTVEPFKARDLHVHQMDVSTAFLNVSLFEDIYMQQPHGFRYGDTSSVCKLKKSLYGLKQAPRIWYALLNKFLVSIGFCRCKKEYCLYRQKWEIYYEGLR